MSETASENSEDRLESLRARPQAKPAGRIYSRFVRGMKILLPLMALAVTVVVLTWDDTPDTIPQTIEQEILEQAREAKNELLDPRFESTDDKDQPFTVTANKATQDPDNPELVRLDNPVADITMKDGAWLAAESEKGVYEQHAEKLFLQGAVKLFHDQGYELVTDEMRVNIDTGQAWSDKDVYIQGPEGTLNAKGLEANMDAGTLIFTGPAKLVLNKSGLDFESGSSKALP